jgi:hypothetical protein
VVALGTPYITPAMLKNAPTGVSWNIIPEPRSSTADQLAEQTNICWRATSIVDTYCNQPLRATVDNEYLIGPGAPRVGFLPGSRVGRLVMRRWPVTQVLAVQRSLTRVMPAAWETVTAGQYEVERPLLNAFTDSASATSPDGGSGILLAPDWVNGLQGRNGQRFLVSYTNGWPHTSLTAASLVGATTLQVDDVTGWAGASGFVYDGASTEPTSVLGAAATTPLQLPNGVGTAQTGPGTITLSAPLTAAHAAGTVVSALPANVLWASVLAAAAQALESGITAIAIQTLPGSETVGGHGVSEIEAAYELLLEPFRRII